MRNLIYISFIIFCVGCYSSSSPDSISKEIESKTNLKLTSNFEIIKAEKFNTPGAFDSDYTWTVELNYLESEEDKIRLQILNSRYFNLKTNSEEESLVRKQIDSSAIKGIWHRTTSGYKFIAGNTEMNQREPFELSIDTVANKLHYELIHL